MKRVIRTKELVERHAMVPNGVFAQVACKHRSYRGLFSYEKIDALEFEGYLLSEESQKRVIHINKTSVNGIDNGLDGNYNTKVNVLIRRDHQQTATWYECEWGAKDRLKYTYSEHDFVDTEEPVEIGSNINLVLSDERQVTGKVLNVSSGYILVEYNAEWFLFDFNQSSGVQTITGRRSECGTLKLDSSDSYLHGDYVIGDLDE